MKIAVVLLSGGLDSTVTLTIAKQECSGEHDKVIPVTFQYGQRHGREVQAAVNVAHFLGCWDSDQVIQVPAVGLVARHSALTDYARELPKGRSAEGMADGPPPASYVPMRNSMLLTMAAAVLESECLRRIEDLEVDYSHMDARLYIGANVLDYSGYPDCRPSYYVAMQDALCLGSKLYSEYVIPMEIKTPIIQFSKRQIIEAGMVKGAPLHLTWSCYEGGRQPCGQCDSCILRAEAFSELGLPDPALQDGRAQQTA